MSKRNLKGLAAMVVGAAVVIAAADPVYYAITDSMEQKKEEKAIAEAAGGQETVTKTGESTGFGGAVTAEVVLAGDKIVGLTLTGDSETPDIGGAAMDKLKEAILAAGGLEGVDAVSGATLTSNGVFEAIKVATGAAEAAKETTEAELEGETVTGEGDGYGGTITAEVALDGDKIVGLKLTGDSETPAIGGAAMDQLKEAILAAGSLDGVDAVSGATWTSNGVFDAINSAMGVETAEEGADVP